MEQDLSWKNGENISNQGVVIDVPGLMYRFSMAHSSRMEANFLKGAPEKF